MCVRVGLGGKAADLERGGVVGMDGVCWFFGCGEGRGEDEQWSLEQIRGR